MFGALALMVDGAMAVVAHKDGSLLVRADPAEDARLVENPEASRAEMGAGRSMGEGWISVEATALVNIEALTNWAEAATRSLAQRKPAHTRAAETGLFQHQIRVRQAEPLAERDRPRRDGQRNHRGFASIWDAGVEPPQMRFHQGTVVTGVDSLGS